MLSSLSFGFPAEFAHMQSSSLELSQGAHGDLPNVLCLNPVLATLFGLSCRIVHQVLHEEDVIEVDQCVGVAGHVLVRMCFENLTQSCAWVGAFGGCHVDLLELGVTCERRQDARSSEAVLGTDGCD